MTDDEKKQIDEMPQYEMCKRWRYDTNNHPLFQGDTGKYFEKVLFEKKGGFTPEISRELGWCRYEL